MNSKWSVTISWESVTVADYLPDDPYKVSAQVTMVQDEITICFGEGAIGPGRSFRTGIQNYTTRVLGYQPATINFSFDELGFASSFPRNTCETFAYRADDPISIPINTFQPTQAPTCPDWNGGPTLPPSTSPTFPWWYYTRLPNSRPRLRPTFPPTAEPSCLQAPNDGIYRPTVPPTFNPWWPTRPPTYSPTYSPTFNWWRTPVPTDYPTTLSQRLNPPSAWRPTRPPTNSPTTPRPSNGFPVPTQETPTPTSWSKMLPMDLIIKGGFDLFPPNGMHRFCFSNNMLWLCFTLRLMEQTGEIRMDGFQVRRIAAGTESSAM